MIIDGKNAVLGRMASQAAKALLNGEEVKIVNAEKVIVTGQRDSIVSVYAKKRSIGSPQHGPFFPTRPDMIVRRTIRSMLPYKTGRGREAFKKLRVYIDIPDELKNEKFQTLAVKEIKTEYMTVGKIAKSIGWSG